VEQISKEHDMNRMADAVGITVGKAKLLHWAVRVYLGEIDAKAPPPQIEEPETAPAPESGAE